ncbi:MAG TPA: polysaccharide deacetylase family protein [Lacipirellulaceae bacterium]|jgi:peptidoglycan/xylan/chitin deacetylase (PgdA/CDA1 family)|nr:polysaccharide deacetylase family protein [Lacipirellulaceae bacterium]
MPSLKEFVLSAYYFSTLRARRRAAIVRAGEHREPVRIAFYHRVADDSRNAWTISCKAFATQIHWLRERFDLVTLAEAQQRIASGRNRFPAACITFDDGYADNRRFAIPLLLKHGVPFTYFVSTDHVLRGNSFPHDVKAGCPLSVNTLAHLRELVAAGVEIGAHTRSHADLGRPLSVEELQTEIVGSKRDLETSLGKPVRYFAFPYGQHQNLSAAAFRVAFEAGLAGVCSAYGGYNFPGDDSFHLRRFHADEEFIRFVNWMTVDSRKVRAHRDFDPGDFRATQEEVSRRGAEGAATVPLITTPDVREVSAIVV